MKDPKNCAAEKDGGCRETLRIGRQSSKKIENASWEGIQCRGKEKVATTVGFR